METDIVTTNAQQTAVMGEKIAEEVKNGGVICLYGDLGSGKTTFTQGLGKALGIEKHVNSPTFLIVRTYELSAKGKEQRAKSFFHIDLYRLGSEKEMEDIGIKEILEDSENIVVVEWAEKLGSLLPDKRVDIRFSYVDEGKRRITIKDV
jgi:tRNA threonylcarbamoyladenosine biosynthesis protein TsaE